MIAVVEPALLTRIGEFLIDPSQPGPGSAHAYQPLALVDLATCPAGVRMPVMPPFPVIGVGAVDHPLAATLDAVVESPISAETLLRQVVHAPHAAAATVQLLRSLDGMPCAPALALESFCYGMLQGSAEHAAWLAERKPMSPSAPGRIIVERRDAVLRVIIDRPLARNAIDRKMRDELFEAFTLASLDPEVRTVQLSAVGSAFSMGGDLEEFGTTRDPATAHLIRSRTLPALPLATRPEIFDVHIQGACVGAGLEIAAFAGRVSASPDAWFQLPELSMGLIPGAGGCVSVPRRIGRQRATLMMLSGRRINAATALAWGLIDAIEDKPPVDDRGAHAGC
jgi:enoyl-CoA hydratase/carnithine racemase